MTDCAECRWAEMTPWERRRRMLREYIFGPDPRDTIAHMGHAMGGVLLAAAGGRRPTPYEAHRAEFERTGDVAELERMLRHVPTPE